MKPIEEKGWTVLKGRDEIADLATFRGDDTAIYSLWRPSLVEKFRIIIGVPVVVGVLSDRQPPIAVKVGRENIPGLTLSPAVIVLLCAIAMSSACTPSKYAVVAPPAEDHQQITLNDEALVAIKKDGSWIWRKAPEQVVQLLVVYAGEVSKLRMSCEAELAKLKPVKAKKAPAAAPKAAK